MMSTKGSAKKTGFNESNEVLYDAFQAVQVPDIFPVTPTWPEWSDADINAEIWTNGRIKSRATTSKGTEQSNVTLDSVATYHLDSEPGSLPHELQRHVHSWKRPHEIFPPNSLTIYDSTNTNLALSVPSEFGANCKLFRFFSDICCILNFYATIEPFPPENETPFYTSNTVGQPWQPWHHIYCSCKAGKDQPHRPVYCSYGKYVLRLYYLGAWRKFIVDDQIPCDSNGKCLLPLTSVTGELWPILLIKGILKITSLTGVSCSVPADVPIWTLLTGWLFIRKMVESHTADETWRLIQAFTPHYVPPEETEKLDVRPIPSISSKGTTKKAAEKKEVGRQTQQEESRPVLLLGELSNFPAGYESLGEVCYVAIIKTRDTPLKKSKMRKPTEPWKRIRWVHWAASKGLWTDELNIPPYRCLYQINFSKQLDDLVCIDKMMEDRLFVQDEDSESESQEELPPNEDMRSPLLWSDFFRFSSYLMSVIFLLKPSSLTSRCKITYITLGPPPVADASTKSKPKAVNFSTEPSHYHLQPNLKVTGNESPILYCESQTGIFISISLWVSPRQSYDVNSYPPSTMQTDNYDFLKFYHGSLIVETYEWHTVRQNKLIAAIKTVGNGTACIFLNPGRHVLKIWLDTDSQFVIDVYSNTEIIVGKGPKIRFNMCADAVLITEYVSRMSVSFNDFIQKFGKPDYRKGLATFYDAIKPGKTIDPGYEGKIDGMIISFEMSLLTTLRSLVTNDDELRLMMKALQTLFVNPNIQCPIAKPTTKIGVSVILNPTTKKGKKDMSVLQAMPAIKERTLSDIVNHEWTPEEIESVVLIQKVFRGYRIRLLLHNQSPNSKEYKTLSEKLRKIYDLIFAPNKRDVEVPKLIKEIITNRPDVLSAFVFHKDIWNVITSEEFTGKIVGVEPKAWVPMIRFMFACHSQDPLPCAFYHSCNLEQFTVTVIDNDTNEEIFRLANATCPHFYPRNGKGYTLFVYGWNELEPKTVNWRLEMVKLKYFADIHPCYAILSTSATQCFPYVPQTLSVQEVRNFYVPNKENKICVCLIKVRKKILLTLRLSMSYENVRFYVKIYLKSRCSESEMSFSQEEVVIEAETKNSAIIFPAVMLEHYPQEMQSDSREGGDQTTYVLEAYVIPNMWPLTRHEWGVIEPIRVHGESWQDNPSATSMLQGRKSSTGSRRRLVRTSKSFSSQQKAIESPFWYLQAVTDMTPDANSVVEVIEDRSYYELIKAMKLSWEENDPGRRQRGKTLQKEFLRGIYDEMVDEKKIYSMSELDLKSSEFFDIVKSLEADLNSSGQDSFEALLHEIRSFSYLLQDKSSTRYLVSPRILPWTPLNDFMTKYKFKPHEVEGSELKESWTEMMGESLVVEEMLKSAQSIQEDERKEMLMGLTKHRKILSDHLARERALSCRLMNQAYEEREKVIVRMNFAKEKMEARNTSDNHEGKQSKNK